MPYTQIYLLLVFHPICAIYLSIYLSTDIIFVWAIESKLLRLWSFSLILEFIFPKNKDILLHKHNT